MKLGQMLLAMIDRPMQAMEAVVTRPKSWWLPAVLIVASLAALTYVSAPYVIEMTNTRQVEVLEQMSANLSAEQMEAARAQLKDMTLSKLMLNSVLMGGALFALGWVIRATVVHLTSMAAGGRGTWATTFAAAGVWSMLPDVVRNIVQTLFVAVNHRAIEHSGLAFLAASGDWLADSRSIGYNLLANLDPFAIWHLVLLTVAIAASTKLGKGKAAAVALFTWVVFLGIKLIPVALSSAFSGSLG